MKKRTFVKRLRLRRMVFISNTKKEEEEEGEGDGRKKEKPPRFFLFSFFPFFHFFLPNELNPKEPEYDKHSPAQDPTSVPTKKELMEWRSSFPTLSRRLCSPTKPPPSPYRRPGAPWFFPWRVRKISEAFRERTWPWRSPASFAKSQPPSLEMNKVSIPLKLVPA